VTDRLVKRAVELIAPDAKPQHIKDVLIQVLQRDHSALKATELADQQFPRVKARLLELVSELEDSEIDPLIRFNPSNPDYIQGPLFIQPRDPPPVREAKLGRLRAQPVRTSLARLTFDRFEIVSAALLSLLGARDYQQTVRSNDQGIDFFGLISLADLLPADFPFFRFQHALQLWLVGQAKHYPNGKVSAPEIRNLVGAINLARFKEYAAATDLLSKLPLRSCDPVFALFLTTGTYTRDAVRLAENSGVVLRDVNDIAKLLCDQNAGVDAAGNCTVTSLVIWATSKLA
jgi:hypothetical protein